MARTNIDLADFIADPMASLRQARHAGWLAELGPGPGVLKYDDVREMLGDPRLRANFPDFLRAFGITSGPFFEWMAMSPLNRDGADHQRWRGVMSRTFTPRRVEQIRPFLATAANQLIDTFATRGACDFVAEFADAFPSLGLCELIGVPKQDRQRFRAWANSIGLGFNPIFLATRIAEVDDALTQLLEYTAELATRRLKEPRDDLVTQIAQTGGRDGWDDKMVSAAIAGLVFAGHETTKNQLGWMIATLSEHPEVWDAVATGDLTPAAVVEEVMRFRSTVTGVGRRLADAVERHGDELPRDTQLLLSLWSANRDESIFPKPDSLDPRANADIPHLAFGHGAHYCLGAALARAELQEALGALSTRLTCPQLESGAEWMPPVGINGPTRLPIRFGLRA